MAATARYFDSRHDDGGVFPGVPKADIDEDTWNSYPKWLQDSVDQSPMYRKTPVPKDKAEPTKEGD